MKTLSTTLLSSLLFICSQHQTAQATEPLFGQEYCSEVRTARYETSSAECVADADALCGEGRIVVLQHYVVGTSSDGECHIQYSCCYGGFGPDLGPLRVSAHPFPHEAYAAEMDQGSTDFHDLPHAGGTDEEDLERLRQELLRSIRLEKLIREGLILEELPLPEEE